MTDRRLEALSVPYDPAALAGRARGLQRQIRSRLFSLGISVVVLIVLAIWRGHSVPGFAVVLGFVAVLGGGLAWLAVVWLGYRRAAQDLAEIGQGEAVRIDRTGVRVAGAAALWPQIAELSVVGAGIGRDDRFRMALGDGNTVSVPLSGLAVRPSTLDEAARAYSGGRRGVELSFLS